MDYIDNRIFVKRRWCPFWLWVIVVPIVAFQPFRYIFSIKWTYGDPEVGIYLDDFIAPQ